MRLEEFSAGRPAGALAGLRTLGDEVLMPGRRRAILEFLAAAPGREATRAEIVRAFPPGDEHRLDVTLYQLHERGEIVRVSRGRWRLPDVPPPRRPRKKPPPRKPMPRRPPKPRPAAPPPPPPPRNLVRDLTTKIAVLRRVIALLRTPRTRERAALAATLTAVVADLERLGGDDAR